MSLRIAIVGASGFIASRAVELLHLGELAEVRPVVRSLNGLARLSRFDLDGRVADAGDESALRTALAGCDVVLHAAAGDEALILGSLAPVYRAAEAAGVRRLVYLSSASVHGQAPPPGTDEEAPLATRQPVAYNNAKVRAEGRLRALRAAGSVELVMLRPGIVTGPRSFWIESFASALLAGSAWLVDGGRGICNSIYVDNLVHAIRLAATVAGADGEAFLVGDAETVTWADLYRPVAEALGFDLRDVPERDYSRPQRGPAARLRKLAASAPLRALGAVVPRRLRRAARAALSLPSPPAPPSPWTDPIASDAARVGQEPTLELALLYRCACKLPHAKATRVLGYRPEVAFPDACHRTIGWMEFAGYPVLPNFRSRSSNPCSGSSTA